MNCKENICKLCKMKKYYNPNETLEGFKVMAEQLVAQMIKPTLEGMGVSDSAKAPNIDEISVTMRLEETKKKLFSFRKKVFKV